MIIKANSPRDFLYKYMRMHAIRDSFSERELQLAVEFLSFRQEYMEKPLMRITITESEDGQISEVEEEMGMLAQLVDPRTVQRIRDKLNMPPTVLRKHVSSLKSKGFFGRDDIAKKFTPPKVGQIQVKLTT